MSYSDIILNSCTTLGESFQKECDSCTLDNVLSLVKKVEIGIHGGQWIFRKSRTKELVHSDIACSGKPDSVKGDNYASVDLKPSKKALDYDFCFGDLDLYQRQGTLNAQITRASEVVASDLSYSFEQSFINKITAVSLIANGATELIASPSIKWDDSTSTPTKDVNDAIGGKTCYDTIIVSRAVYNVLRLHPEFANNGMFFTEADQSNFIAGRFGLKSLIVSNCYGEDTVLFVDSQNFAVYGFQTPAYEGADMLVEDKVNRTVSVRGYDLRTNVEVFYPAVGFIQDVLT